jgi:hypothetical protein
MDRVCLYLYWNTARNNCLHLEVPFRKHFFMNLMVLLPKELQQNST